jgi:phosphate acetyltransferase
MRFIETVFQKLKRHPKRIVFPDATEPRVLRAAARFVKLQLGAPVVLGRKEEIEKVALEEGVSLDHIGIVDPQTSSELQPRAAACVRSSSSSSRCPRPQASRVA